MVLDEIERLLNTPMDVLEKKIKQYQPELERNRQTVKRFAEHHIDKIINLLDVQ
jgi:hypothetical protein